MEQQQSNADKGPPIPATIDRLMKAMGLSSLAAGKRIGVSRQTISRYRNGAPIGIGYDAVAKALKVDVDLLYLPPDIAVQEAAKRHPDLFS